MSKEEKEVLLPSRGHGPCTGSSFYWHSHSKDQFL